jgi:hypothetical protein
MFRTADGLAARACRARRAALWLSADMAVDGDGAIGLSASKNDCGRRPPPCSLRHWEFAPSNGRNRLSALLIWLGRYGVVASPGQCRSGVGERLIGDDLVRDAQLLQRLGRLEQGLPRDLEHSRLQRLNKRDSAFEPIKERPVKYRFPFRFDLLEASLCSNKSKEAKSASANRRSVLSLTFCS